MTKKLWFKRKTYGWGWTPSSWEGWAVLAVYLVVLFSTIVTIDHEWLKNLVVIFVLTSILILICYKTGESPRWQWGERKKTR